MGEPPTQEDPTPTEPAPRAPGRDSLLQIGSILAGRYRILGVLGEGAMGSVYLGEHLRIGRKDAIKVLRDSLAGDTEAMARFVRGARSVSRIRHENVCTIYDFSDTAEGIQFLAMEYIPGTTLKDVLTTEGTLPVERVVSITIQAAGALQAAHEAGIVHRDLKPANIMLMPGRDGADIVKVVDFDIAKAEDDGGETEVTRFGFVVGTPEYMSPEQLTGEHLDGRSDVYSLALVVYRMLTGLLPFQVENTREMLVSRLTKAPLTLEQGLPGRSFQPALQQVLDWALQRDRENRAPSTAAFAHALVQAVGTDAGKKSLATATPPAPAMRLDREPQRAADEIPATRVTDASVGRSPSQPATTGAGAKPAGERQKLLVVAAVVVLGMAAAGALALHNGQGTASDDAAPTAGESRDSGLTADGVLDRAPDGSDSIDVYRRETAAGFPVSPPVTRDPGVESRNTEIRRDPGTGSATTGTPPASRPIPAASVHMVDVDSAIFRQFRAAFEFSRGGTPERSVLEAVRDTALAGFEQTTNPVQQMRAAYALGIVLYHLGRFQEGLPWAQTALKLCTTNCQTYSLLVDTYGSRVRE